MQFIWNRIDWAIWKWIQMMIMEKKRQENAKQKRQTTNKSLSVNQTTMQCHVWFLCAFLMFSKNTDCYQSFYFHKLPNVGRSFVNRLSSNCNKNDNVPWNSFISPFDPQPSFCVKFEREYEPKQWTKYAFYSMISFEMYKYQIIHFNLHFFMVLSHWTQNERIDQHSWRSSVKIFEWLLKQNQVFGWKKIPIRIPLKTSSHEALLSLIFYFSKIELWHDNKFLQWEKKDDKKREKKASSVCERKKICSIWHYFNRKKKVSKVLFKKCVRNPLNSSVILYRPMPIYFK